MTGLFLTDLDGTLLDGDRNVPERNHRGIAAAAEAGVAVAIVTGRRATTVTREYSKLAGLTYRVAASNGAVILDPDNGRAEDVHDLTWDVADALAHLAELAHAPLLAITEPDWDAAPGEGLPDCIVLAPGDRRYLASWTPHRRDTLVETAAAPARARALVHLAFHLETRDEAHALEGLVAATVPGELGEVHVVLAPYGPGALLEVVARGGKARAARHFADALGVPATATGAIGDELNDEALLDATALRYAVGGSVLARRRPDATAVAPAAEGAVGDALERFLDTLC